MSGVEPEARELRRTYHDHIAEVREGSQQIVAAAVTALRDANAALSEGDMAASEEVDDAVAQMADVSKAVGRSVLELLAREAPLARDLRMLIASRDVTQFGLLSLGLCATLATRAPSVCRVLEPDVRTRVDSAGQATLQVLEVAEQAWRGVDPDLAARVVSDALEARVAQMELLTALIGLRDVPMDAALDLGMVSRSYERILDHAVEIAQQVTFAVGQDGSAP